MARMPKTVELTTPNALDAINKFAPDAKKAIETALTAEKKSDTTAQDVAHFALMHGEAVKRASNAFAEWKQLVGLNTDRKLTKMGKQWIKEVKLHFCGPRPSVKASDPKTKGNEDLLKAWNARVGMTDRGCRLAIIAGCFGGTSADYKSGKLSITDHAFIPLFKPALRPEMSAKFMWRDVKPAKVALDSGNYLIMVPNKKEDATEYLAGKFTMTQAINTFFRVRKRAKQTGTGTTEAVQGSDTNKSDQVDSVMKRNVLKNADLKSDLIPEIVRRLQDKSDKAPTWEDFEGDGSNPLQTFLNLGYAMQEAYIARKAATNGAPKPLPSGGAAAVAEALKTA